MNDVLSEVRAEFDRLANPRAAGGAQRFFKDQVIDVAHASTRAASTVVSTFGFCFREPGKIHRHECRCGTPGGVRHITFKVSDAGH